MPFGRGRRQGRRWWVLTVGLAAMGMAVPSARAAGPWPEVENLRVGFASNAQNNLFKVGAWTPVEVQIRGGNEPFSGTMEVEVPDDDGTATSFRTNVDVPASQSVRVVAYARPGSRDPSFVIRLYDQRGRRRVQAEGANLATLSAVMPDETMLLTLGKPSGVEQVPALPGFTTEPSAGGQPEFRVGRVDVAAGSMPGRWYGYDAAEAVVVDTNDKEVMQALTVRGQALVDWVARGGHLVVGVGGNWQSARDSVLGPILPAVPTGQVRVPSLEVLDSYAGSNNNPITPAGSPAVLVTKLEQADSRGGKVLSATGDVPLVVRGAHGFGRVTLVALDLDAKPFSEWRDRALFWVKALDIRRQPGEAASTTVRLGGGRGRMTQSGVSDLATQLRTALEQFPGVKLIPFGWVAFFIFLYILLIGPGDYLFLKKVVKRMELTWITFPTIVLTVSLVAYFAAYIVKGKELRVNKVDVVDVDQASGLARGSTFFNLFSPQNRDYDVSVVPLALDRNPPAKDDADADGPAARPPAGTEVMVSWLGVPEPGFGGMGNSSRMGFSGGGYASMPVGTSEMLEGVRIPIWSTKLLTGRWFGPAPVLAEADLVPVGTDRLAGTVTNRLPVAMKDAIVAFGKHVYIIGDLAPGESKRVELAQDRQLSGLMKSRSGNVMPDPSAASDRIGRPDLVLALMFHDSQSTFSSERQMANNPLHYLDLTGQLALDRPMLVGRLDRPAARLVLGNAPAPPRIDQTTMLRVILPLGKPPGEEDAKKARQGF
jgi:hypothetical protein